MNIIIAALLAAASVFAAAFFTISSSESVAESARKLRDSERAEQDALRGLAFAAGFLYGQRNLIAAAGLPLNPPKLVRGSIEARDAARKAGFTMADKDNGIPE